MGPSPGDEGNCASRKPSSVKAQNTAPAMNVAGAPRPSQISPERALAASKATPLNSLNGCLRWNRSARRLCGEISGRQGPGVASDLFVFLRGENVHRTSRGLAMAIRQCLRSFGPPCTIR